MDKLKLAYNPPQVYAEPFDCALGLCQASGGELQDPTTVDDLTWGD